MVIRRLSLVSLLLLALLALGSLKAIATEGDGVTETTVAETTGESEVSGDLTPAVEINEDAPDESNLDWTYRYMIPTGILLGAVVIVITAGQYFMQVVRKRYRIVEE
jgi:hypothetical protein